MSRRPGPPPNAAPPAPAGAGSWPAGWWCALIFLAALVAYFPALSGDFLWDDSGHVTNRALQSLSGLMRIWFEPGVTQQYYPLLHSAFWLEHWLWGDATLGYHLINVLQHVTAACLFATLLRRLAVPGAWLAALLFTLHPVCVESVAWITEQKNTLSAVFYLAAALAWLRFDAERSPRRYLLATGLFVLALLTKTVTATLPAALLVLAWWRHSRFEWRRDVRPLLPWFALGIASGLFTAHFERELIGAQGADFELGGMARGLLAGRVVWFYAAKLLWPANLIFIYPRWNVDAAVWWQWLFPLAALALLAALAWWSRRLRAPLAAALLFGGTLFPVLGFVNVYPFIYSFVADHFQYLASLPVFALGAAGLVALMGRLPRGTGAAALSVLLAGLGALTWRQAGMYRDITTLYETTIARNPECWMAHNNLANVLVDSGRVADAVPHLETALRLRPDFTQALSNLGDALVRLRRPAEALPFIERALQLQPRYPEALNNRGNALLALGRTSEAQTAYEEALKIRPGYAIARLNLGLALATAGRPAEALPHFEQAAGLNPWLADAHFNWALALTVTGRFAEAPPHFERALELAPESVPYYLGYGRILEENGRTEAAVTHYQEAVRLAPEMAEAHLNLAFALRKLGRLSEAAPHFMAVERLNPGLLRKN